MISIYSLRLLSTFLYTIINDNVIASSVQKKENILRFCGPKKLLRTYATLKPPPPPLYAIVHIWLDHSPPPFYVSTMWMTPNLETFSSLQNKLSSLIKTSKQEYFSKIAKKLSDASISSKTYWSILKSFLTGKKLPCHSSYFSWK